MSHASTGAYTGACSSPSDDEQLSARSTSSPGELHICVQSHIPEANENGNQLTLMVGDHVIVTEKHASGWWGGNKVDNEAPGWFPKTCVEAVSEDPTASAQIHAALQAVAGSADPDVRSSSAAVAAAAAAAAAATKCCYCGGSGAFSPLSVASPQRNAELRELRSCLETTEKELANTKTELHQTVKRLTQAEAQLQAANHQLKRAEWQKMQEQEGRSQAEQEANVLRGRIAALEEAHLSNAGLKHQLDQCKSELVSKRSTIEMLEAKLRDARSARPSYAESYGAPYGMHIPGSQGSIVLGGCARSEATTTEPVRSEENLDQREVTSSVISPSSPELKQSPLTPVTPPPQRPLPRQPQPPIVTADRVPMIVPPASYAKEPVSRAAAPVLPAVGPSQRAHGEYTPTREASASHRSSTQEGRYSPLPPSRMSPATPATPAPPAGSDPSELPAPGSVRARIMRMNAGLNRQGSGSSSRADLKASARTRTPPGTPGTGGARDEPMLGMSPMRRNASPATWSR